MRSGSLSGQEPASHQVGLVRSMAAQRKVMEGDGSSKILGELTVYQRATCLRKVLLGGKAKMQKNMRRVSLMWAGKKEAAAKRIYRCPLFHKSLEFKVRS